MMQSNQVWLILGDSYSLNQKNSRGTGFPLVSKIILIFRFSRYIFLIRKNVDHKCWFFKKQTEEDQECFDRGTGDRKTVGCSTTWIAWYSPNSAWYCGWIWNKAIRRSSWSNKIEVCKNEVPSNMSYLYQTITINQSSSAVIWPAGSALVQRTIYTNLFSDNKVIMQWTIWTMKVIRKKAKTSMSWDGEIKCVKLSDQYQHSDLAL